MKQKERIGVGWAANVSGDYAEGCSISQQDVTDQGQRNGTTVIAEDYWERRLEAAMPPKTPKAHASLRPISSQYIPTV
jgi:hypothetical protein